MSQPSQPDSYKSILYPIYIENYTILKIVATASVYAFIPLLSLPNLLYGSQSGFTLFEGIFYTLVALTITLWGVFTLYEGRLEITRGTMLTIVFILVCALSIVHVAVFNYSLIGWLRQWYAFGLLLLVFPLTKIFHLKKARVAVTIAIIASSTVVSIFGLSSNVLAYVSGGPEAQLFTETGLSSTMPVWGSILLISVLMWSRDKTTRIITLTLLLIHLIRVIIGTSRNAALGIGGATLILLFIYVIDEKDYSIGKILSGIIAFFGLLGAVVLWLRTRIFILSPEGIYRGFAVRYLLNKAAINDALNRPLFGNGFGYNYYDPFTIKTPWNNYTHVIDNVHNLYIYIFSHVGLIGLALYLLILLTTFLILVRTITAELSVPTVVGSERGILFGLLGLLLTMQVFFLLSVRGYQTETQLTLAYIVAASQYYGLSYHSSKAI